MLCMGYTINKTLTEFYENVYINYSILLRDFNLWSILYVSQYTNFLILWHYALPVESKNEKKIGGPSNEEVNYLIFDSWKIIDT